jgi:hypothetical protein
MPEVAFALSTLTFISCFLATRVAAGSYDAGSNDASAPVGACMTTAVPDSRCQDLTCGWQNTETFRKNLGKPCVFPFVYQGIEYHSCTAVDHDRPWCATTEGFRANEGNWGNCEKDTCLDDEDDSVRVQFPCSKLPTCCVGDFDHKMSSFAPPVRHQATYVVGVKSPSDRDQVIEELFKFDRHNEDTGALHMSKLKQMFLAELNPLELGFLLNHTRVTFVECNSITTDHTLHGPRSGQRHLLRGK